MQLCCVFQFLLLSQIQCSEASVVRSISVYDVYVRMDNVRSATYETMIRYSFMRSTRGALWRMSTLHEYLSLQRFSRWSDMLERDLRKECECITLQ
jgi:hypothetical protein